MKRRALGLALLMVLATALGSPAVGGVAEAAKPNNHACLGTDISGYATALQPLGQNLIVTLSAGGAGGEVQAHLAGLVPDASGGGIDNTCND